MMHDEQFNDQLGNCDRLLRFLHQGNVENGRQMGLVINDARDVSDAIPHFYELAPVWSEHGQLVRSPLVPLADG